GRHGCALPRQRQPGSRRKPQRCGTARPPVPAHPPHARRDRRPLVRLPQHREVAGDLHLPQARRVLAQRRGAHRGGSRPLGRPRAYAATSMTVSSTSTVIEAVPDNRIERSPSDLLRMIVAFAVLLGLLLLDWLAGDTLVKFAHDFLSGLNA